MAEVNLHTWPEISQASEGLQLNSTAATLEYINAWLARLETRLVEHERRAAATLPPLRPEPDPPDGPPVVPTAQPQFQFSPLTSNTTSVSLLHQTDQPSPPTPEPAPPYSGSALPTTYSAAEYHSRLLEFQPPLVENQPAHDAHYARHSVGCQQHQFSNLNIDGQPLYPSYQPDEYEHWANEQLPVHQQLPSTGFDSRRVGEISTPRVPEPPPHPAIDPLYDLRPWEILGQRALHEYSSYDQPPQHPPTCWETPGQRAFHEYSPYDQSPCPPCRWNPPAQRAIYGYLPQHVQQPQLDPTPPSEAPSYGLPTWDYCVQQEHHAYDQQQYKQWQNRYNQTHTEIPAAYTPSWRPESTPSIFAPVQSVAVTKFESEEVIYGSMYGSEHRMRNREGAMSDSSILDAPIEYSCDDAKDFNCASDRGVMEEKHCVTLDRGLSIDSILEMNANKVIDCEAAYSNTGNRANQTMGLSSNISREEDNSSGERREIQCIVEEHKAIDEHEVAFEVTNLGLKVEKDVRRRLFDDERRLNSKQLGEREGAYTGLKIFAYVYGDLHLADATSFDHQSVLFDDDSRWIPPRKDTSCLSILGRVDRLPVLTLTFGNHIGHPLIFYGGDERRKSLVLCPFDPGGMPRQSFCFQLSLLLRDSHLEDKVDFNRGGVDTLIISYYFISCIII